MDPTASSPESKCTIDANPDVTGTGIRVSIYVLALLLPLSSILLHKIRLRPSFLAFKLSIASALRIQGLALLFTAVYQSLRHELTLFHAISVVHLLSLLGVNVTIQGDEGEEGKSEKPFQMLYFRLESVIGILLTCISTLLFLAWAIWIFRTAPDFGSQASCNSSTIYVIFGVSVPITNPVVRYFLVAVLSLAVIGIIISTGLLLLITALFRKIFGKSWPKAMGLEALHQHAQAEKHGGQWIPPLATLIFNIYAIVSLEQTISRNNLDKEEEMKWTFGQIIALFMLVGVAIELMNVGVVEWDKRKEKKRSFVVHQRSGGGRYEQDQYEMGLLGRATSSGVEQRPTTDEEEDGSRVPLARHQSQSRGANSDSAFFRAEDGYLEMDEPARQTTQREGRSSSESPRPSEEARTWLAYERSIT